MSATLPALIEPHKLAERRAVLAGKLRCRHFARLADLIQNRDAEVTVTISFQVAERIAYARGRLDGSFALKCDRCLESFDYQLRTTFAWEFVASECAECRLGAEFEPVVLASGAGLSLYELIEDELLLSLPFAPRHAGSCGSAEADVSRELTSAAGCFAVLSGLKVQGDK